MEPLEDHFVCIGSIYCLGVENEVCFVVLRCIVCHRGGSCRWDGSWANSGSAEASGSGRSSGCSSRPGASAESAAVRPDSEGRPRHRREELCRSRDGCRGEGRQGGCGGRWPEGGGRVEDDRRERALRNARSDRHSYAYVRLDRGGRFVCGRREHLAGWVYAAQWRDHGGGRRQLRLAQL